MRVLIKAFSLAVVGAMFTAFLPAAAAFSTGSGTCWDYRAAERKFARKINVARDIATAGGVRLDPQLSKVARKHTKEMVRADSLHHTPSEVLGRRVTNWRVLGENVGVGGSVDSLQRAFMTSPAHRDNVLYPSFKHVGIGVIRRPDRLWVTVIFESRNNPGTRLQMPSC